MADGILERIEAQNAEILALLKGGAAPKTTTKAAAKAAPAKPAFTAEQLRDKYIEVQKKHGDAEAKALITEAGYTKLAELVGDADKWQNSWDLAEAKLAEEPADDNGGL